jgi:hypothetical protein
MKILRRLLLLEPPHRSLVNFFRKSLSWKVSKKIISPRHFLLIVIY